VPSRTQAPPQSARWKLVLAALPNHIVAASLAILLAVAVGATAGLLTWWLVGPLALLAYAALWRFVPATDAPSSADTTGAALAVAGAAGWVALNLPLAAELFVPRRDPSLYLTLAAWMSQHEAPAIDINRGLELADGIEGTTAQLGAFTSTLEGVVYLQGGDLLPGVLAVGGWLAGIEGILATNIVIGAVGMLAVYGLARTVLGPLVSLVPVFALAASTPYAYLSRATYSEGIMLLVCAAGLAWLIASVREGRTGLAVVGGVFVGVAGYARIDAPAALIGPIIALGALALATPSDRLPRLTRSALAFTLAGGFTMTTSVVALALNDRPYLKGHLDEIIPLWLVLVGFSVAAGVMFLVRHRVMAAELSTRTLRVLAITAVSIVVGLWIFWLSRPLWYEGHFQVGPVVGSVERLQERAGLEIDGTRSYEELTMYWVIWYYGIVAVLLACVGFAMLLYRGVREAQVAAVVLVFATLAVMGMYFTKVSITPDQIWAYRRLLPIITPGVLIAATVPVQWLLKGRWPLRAAAVVAGAAIAITPIIAWTPLIAVVEGRGEQEFTETICEAVGDRTVAMVGPSAPPNFALTLRTVCDTDVVTVHDPSQEVLGALAERDDDLAIVWWNEDTFPASDGVEPLVESESVRWQGNLIAPADRPTIRTYRAWIGTLDASGDVATESVR